MQAPPELKIINETPNPVYYRIIESVSMSYIFLGNPCDNFKANLLSGEEVVITYDDITGYDDEAESARFSGRTARGMLNLIL